MSLFCIVTSPFNIVFQVFSSEQNPEECDATDADSSNAAGKIKLDTSFVGMTKDKFVGMTKDKFGGMTKSSSRYFNYCCCCISINLR